MRHASIFILILGVIFLAACSDTKPAKDTRTKVPLTIREETATAVTPTMTETAIPTSAPTDNPPTNLPQGGGSQPTVLISEFSSERKEVFAARLATTSERIPVRWNVQNRPENSNLVFEQVLANGTVKNIELPRAVQRVDSAGQGMVAPTAPGGNATSITLQLRVINPSTGTLYATKQITLPISTDPTEGVTVLTNCFSDPLLASNDVTIGEFGQVRNPIPETRVPLFDTPAGLDTGKTAMGGFRVTIVEGPFCFRATDGTTYRRWKIDYDEIDVIGWINEYATVGGQTAIYLQNTMPADATVKAFSVSAAAVNEGDSVTISWEVENIERVAIYIANAQEAPRPITPDSDHLPLSGSVTIPIPAVERNSIIMHYPADLVTPLTVEVTCNIDLISGEQFGALVCPRAPQTVTAVYQPFQYGRYMIWMNRQIVVFRDDNFVINIYPDIWQEGETLTYPAEPPSGLLAPVRGFGKVWIQNRELQDTLGWASGSEQSYTAQVQAIPVGIDRLEYILSLPDGSYIYVTRALPIS